MQELVIVQSDSRGGKAGRYLNKTASIQVRAPLPGGGYQILKAVRYTKGDQVTLDKAMEKAKYWKRILEIEPHPVSLKQMREASKARLKV